MEVVNIRDFRNSNLTVGALRNDQYTFRLPRQEISIVAINIEKTGIAGTESFVL